MLTLWASETTYSVWTCNLTCLMGPGVRSETSWFLHSG